MKLQAEKGVKVIAVNKKAAFDYFFIETVEAGIALQGSEVKSVKLGHVSLNDCFCHAEGGGLTLKNMFIKNYEKTGAFAPDERRSRALLLHKGEIKRLIGKTREKGLTLIPTKLYFKGRFVKVTLALCKGKKNYDKRQTIKERDQNRSAEREIALYKKR